MKKNQYILMIIGALVIGGLSFFAGMRYQLSKVDSLATANNRGTLQGQQIGTKTSQQGNTKMGQNSPQGGGMVSGEITSKDGQSLTVKMADGSTKIVIIADSTSYKKSTNAVAADLAVGENVTVIGISNTDGSVTAKTVTIGETMMPIGQGRPN